MEETIVQRRWPQMEEKNWSEKKIGVCGSLVGEAHVGVMAVGEAFVKEKFSAKLSALDVMEEDPCRGIKCVAIIKKNKEGPCKRSLYKLFVQKLQTTSHN